jgi:hypothetical protein
MAPNSSLTRVTGHSGEGRPPVFSPAPPAGLIHSADLRVFARRWTTLVCIALLTACSQPSLAPTATSNTGSPIPTRISSAGSVVRTSPITGAAGEVVAMAEGDGSLWVATSSSPHGHVIRIDLTSGRTQANIAVGWAPGAIAIDGRRVWVSDTIGDGSQAQADQNHIEEIDAGTNVVITKIDVPVPTGLALTAGAAWVISPDGGSYSTLRKFDVATGKSEAAIRIPEAGATRLALAMGDLWTSTWSGSASSHLWPVEPDSAKLLPAKVTAGNISSLSSDGTDLFVMGSPEVGSVARIGASTGGVLATSGPYDGLQGIAVASGSLWLTTADGDLHRLATIDLTEKTSPVPLGGAPATLIAAASVWVATANGLVEVAPTPGS